MPQAVDAIGRGSPQEDFVCAAPDVARLAISMKPSGRSPAARPASPVSGRWRTRIAVSPRIVEGPAPRRWHARVSWALKSSCRMKRTLTPPAQWQRDAKATAAAWRCPQMLDLPVRCTSHVAPVISIHLRVSASGSASSPSSESAWLISPLAADSAIQVSQPPRTQSRSSDDLAVALASFAPCPRKSAW